MERYEAKVIEEPKQIKAKYGYCSLVKLKLLHNNEEVIVFSKQDDANILKRQKEEVVECYRDNNQKWKIIHSISNSNIQMNRLSHDSKFNRNYYTHNNSSNSNEEIIEDIIEDVPMLSNADKKKIARFIDQQAALYRYTVNAVKKEFPELVGIDDRGIRSIALSLLINTNMVINKNL